MKKTYRIKNYKGNLVESLTKFAESHKGMRIVEAVEAEDELKIKTEAFGDEEGSPELVNDFVNTFASDLKKAIEQVAHSSRNEDSFEKFREFFGRLYNGGIYKLGLDITNFKNSQAIGLDVFGGDWPHDVKKPDYF